MVVVYGVLTSKASFLAHYSQMCIQPQQITVHITVLKAISQPATAPRVCVPLFKFRTTPYQTQPSPDTPVLALLFLSSLCNIMFIVKYIFVPVPVGYPSYDTQASDDGGQLDGSLLWSA